MAKLKLKHLESYLEDVKGFSEPKHDLEQFQTTPHLAATALHTIESRFRDIGGKLIADLGCGCGMLTIGAVMLSARACIGFEIDEDALTDCRQNLSEFGIANVDLVQVDVREQLSVEDGNRWNRMFDCVIMNPPFGTRENTEGSDCDFVKVALQLSRGSVYSMHKSARREDVRRLAKSLNVEIELVAHLRYNLPTVYKGHECKPKTVEVDLYRFSRVPPGQTPMDHYLPLHEPLVAPKNKGGNQHSDKRLQNKHKVARKK